MTPGSRLHARAAGREGLIGLTIASVSLLPLLLAPVRAQLLGPAARGEFAFFQSSLTLVAAVAGLGLRHAAYSLGAVGERRFDTSLRPVLITGTLLGGLAAAPLLAIASRSMSAPVVWALIAVLVFLPGYVSHQFELATVQSRGATGRIAAGVAGPGVVEFLGTLTAVIARSLTLTVALAVTAVAEVWRILLALSWRLRDPARRERRRADAASGRALARAALVFAPAGVLPVVGLSVDVLVYGALVPATALGVYVVAKIGLALMGPFAAVMEGRALRTAGERGVRAVCVRYGAMFALVALLVSAVGSPLMVPLFGEEYAEARFALPIAAAAGAIRALYVLLLAVAAARGRGRLSVVASAAVAVATAAGALLYGLLGHGHSVLMTAILLGAQTIGLVVLLAAYAGSARDRRTSAGNALHGRVPA